MFLMFADESESIKSQFMVFAGVYYNANQFDFFEKDLARYLSNKRLSSLEEVKDRKMSRELRNEINRYIATRLSEIGAKIISVVVHGSRNPSSYVNGIPLLRERFFKEIKHTHEFGVIFYDEDKSREYILEKSLLGENHIKQGRDQYISNVHEYIPNEEVQSRIRYTLADNQQFYSIQTASLISGALEKAILNMTRKNIVDGVFGETVVDKLPDYFYGLKPYWALFSRSPNGRVYGWGVKEW